MITYKDLAKIANFKRGDTVTLVNTWKPKWGFNYKSTFKVKENVGKELRICEIYSGYRFYFEEIDAYIPFYALSLSDEQQQNILEYIKNG